MRCFLQESILLHSLCISTQSLSHEKVQSFNIMTDACRGIDEGIPDTPALPPASPLTHGRSQAPAQTLTEQVQQQQQQQQPVREGLPTRQSTRAAAQAGRRFAKAIPLVHARLHEAA